MGLIRCTLPNGPFKSVVLCLFPDHLQFALQEGLGESMEGFTEMQTTCRWESLKSPVSAVCFLKLFADSGKHTLCVLCQAACSTPVMKDGHDYIEACDLLIFSNV